MEHKRDADSAGLTWPRSNTRTTQSTSLSSDASSSAVPLNPPPQGNPMAPTTLGSSSTGDNSLTNSGMYSTGTHPPTPFPTSEHRHPPPPHQGRFSERLVHQIHFKIFTHSNNTQELFVMEIPTTGISRTRDPEHFFYAMSGQWEWSQHTADYWRHCFGVPMRHGTNPFEDYFPPDMEPAITRTPRPAIAVLATELQELLSAPSISGELSDQLSMVQRMTFSAALQILATSQSTSLEVNSTFFSVACAAFCTIDLQLPPLPKKETLPTSAGCVCVCHICTDVKLRFLVTIFICRGHGSCFPSHANEAMGSSRKGMWTHIPVPAFLFVRQAAKPRTAKLNLYFTVVAIWYLFSVINMAILFIFWSLVSTTFDIIGRLIHRFREVLPEDLL